MPGVESHDFIPARDQRITSLECNLNSTYKDPVSQNNNYVQILGKEELDYCRLSLGKETV